MSNLRGGKEPAITDDAHSGPVNQVVADLQKQLTKKQTFEGAVISFTEMFTNLYTSASESDRAMIYSLVCRVGTLLKTRYTSVGFWMAGLKLFETALKLVSKPDQKEHMKSCIAKAHEIIGDSQRDESPAVSRPTAGFLFEGQLTVDPEPRRPAWLVAQNVIAALVSQDEQRNANDGQTSRADLPDMTITQDLHDLMERVHDLNGISPDLEDVIQASLQEAGVVARGPPPASKEAVAKLPVKDVTDSMLKELGEGVECAVCREELVVGAKMQEMPCKHLFHPDCLKPWLDEHNSCPVCRFELRTDDHDYESKKERDKEFEEERKGAENALPGGEFMYI